MMRQLELAERYNRSMETANSYFYSNGILVAELVIESIKRVKTKGVEVTIQNVKIELDLMNADKSFQPFTTVGPVTFTSSDHAGVNTLQIYNIQNGEFKTYGDSFESIYSN